MTVERIGHITIRSRRVAETIGFYEQALGLRRGRAATTRDQDNNAWLYAADGAPLIHVNFREAGEAEPGRSTPTRLDHVAFDCADLAGMRQR